MADRPIIFSAPMVRALLDGRKTQTRRVLKPQPPERPAPNCHPSYKQKHPAPYLDAYCGERATAANPRGMSRDWHWWQVDDRPGPVACRAPYAPGDRLWVREAWASDGMVGVRYYATDDVHELRRKRSPIHMPRWASRLTLLVTDVRVQRLQEISEADAKAEGVGGVCWEDWRDYGGPSSYRLPFRSLWNSIHGHDAWDDNPGVCALTFTVHRCNIDQMDRDVQREEGTW